MTDCRDPIRINLRVAEVPFNRNLTKPVNAMVPYNLVQFCNACIIDAQVYLRQPMEILFKAWCRSSMSSLSLSSQLFIRHVNVDPVRISRVGLDNQSGVILGYSPTMILTFVTKFDKWQCTAVGLNSNFNQSTSIK